MADQGKGWELDGLCQLRRRLHENAERSGREEKTKSILKEFLRERTSLEVVEKGKWFYAVKRGAPGGERIAFRADMDGVLSPEGHAAHRCGHDGHCAALAGLGLLLAGKPGEGSIDIGSKTVFLLFQHGEETGEGAKECKAFLKEEGVGEIYGFHNIPGEPRGQVLLLEDTFACASKGMAITFRGKPSHAAYPELGVNPAFAIGELITRIPKVQRPEDYKKMVLCTIIKAQVGEEAYGVSASQGQLLLTIRGELEEDLEKLQNALEELAKELAGRDGLEYGISYQEEFPATKNHPCCVEKVRQGRDSHKGFGGSLSLV